MMNAIRRNKRLGLKRISMPAVNELPKDDYSKFLEYYVFSNLGTPDSLLRTIEHQYYADQDIRDRRQRNVDFIRGRQFNELIYDPELKRRITLAQYYAKRGKPVLTYNVMSKLQRSLTGQFREINTGNIIICKDKDSKGTEYATMLTKCLEWVKRNNKARDKDAMNFKEMLNSGRPVYKVSWSNFGNIKKTDIRFRIVLMPNYNENPGIVDYDKDNHHTSVEIHDTSLNDIVTEFAAGDYERGMLIKRHYEKHHGVSQSQNMYTTQSYDGSQMRDRNFYNQGGGMSYCRYIEIWKKIADYEAITYDPLNPIEGYVTHKWRSIKDVKKAVDMENESRMQNGEGLDPEEYKISFKADFVSRWYAIYMTPWGVVLGVKESPYKHSGHPYVSTPPDINGELWGLMEEVIPAQFSLDRHIDNADSVIDNASKGLLLIPDSAVPDDFTNAEYVSEAKKWNGAIVYKVTRGMENFVPQQIYANSSNVSNQVQQMIQLYSGLVDEISGNYGAAQGKSGQSKTATGYALESQNAGLNVRDIMDRYMSMLKERDQKILNLMIEGYTAADYRMITGEDIDIKDIKRFSYIIEENKGTNSPAHRLALEQELLQLVYNQLLPFEVFLEVSNNPAMIQAKQKYEEWKKKQADMQMQMPQGQPMGGSASANVPPMDEKMMVQGHPQANLLKEQPIKQQLPDLNKV